MISWNITATVRLKIRSDQAIDFADIIARLNIALMRGDSSAPLKTAGTNIHADVICSYTVKAWRAAEAAEVAEADLRKAIANVGLMVERINIEPTDIVVLTSVN